MRTHTYVYLRRVKPVLKRHLASLEKRGYISRIDRGNTL